MEVSLPDHIGTGHIVVVRVVQLEGNISVLISLRSEKLANSNGLLGSFGRHSQSSAGGQEEGADSGSLHFVGWLNLSIEKRIEQADWRVIESCDCELSCSVDDISLHARIDCLYILVTPYCESQDSDSRQLVDWDAHTVALSPLAVSV